MWEISLQITQKNNLWINPRYVILKLYFDFLSFSVNSGYKQETIRKIRRTREKFIYQRKLLENLPDFDQSINEFKTACLKTNSVIFSDENMEISENRQIIQKKGRKVLKVIICFTNKKNEAINGFSIEFFAENGFFS